VDGPGVAVRRASLHALHACLVLGRPLDEGAAFHALPRADDRALARALVSTALRWLPDLDRLIDSACARPLPDDSRARLVLRLALAGRLVLSTPMHATIAANLPLLEGGPRRLAHAVLSRLDREGAALSDAPSLPEPWATRWREAHGPDFVAAARLAHAAVAPTDLSLRHPAETGLWAARLGGTSLAPGHVRLDGSVHVAALPGFAEGAWWVQDLAARRPVDLLGDIAGVHVLDVCAAPGGKTMQLASSGARVTALDRNDRRMQKLAENLARTSLRADCVVADALSWTPERPFDAILLDAPCTATGTGRRHPEVLYRRTLADVSGLAELQAALLARAAGWLCPGGRLVYATCSNEREEGEAIVGEHLPAGLHLLHAERLVPGQPGDGFFAALLERVA
jgi:16S rRNA (cytosine967-C5)-methyltransferase